MSVALPPFVESAAESSKRLCEALCPFNPPKLDREKNGLDMNGSWALWILCICAPNKLANGSWWRKGSMGAVWGAEKGSWPPKNDLILQKGQWYERRYGTSEMIGLGDYFSSRLLRFLRLLILHSDRKLLAYRRYSKPHRPLRFV